MACANSRPRWRVGDNDLWFRIGEYRTKSRIRVRRIQREQHSARLQYANDSGHEFGTPRQRNGDDVLRANVILVESRADVRSVTMQLTVCNYAVTILNGGRADATDSLLDEEFGSVPKRCVKWIHRNMTMRRSDRMPTLDRIEQACVNRFMFADHVLNREPVSSPPDSEVAITLSEERVLDQ